MFLSSYNRRHWDPCESHTGRDLDLAETDFVAWREKPLRYTILTSSLVVRTLYLFDICVHCIQSRSIRQRLAHSFCPTIYLEWCLALWPKRWQMLHLIGRPWRHESLRWFSTWQNSQVFFVWWRSIVSPWFWGRLFIFATVRLRDIWVHGASVVEESRFGQFTLCTEAW